MASRIATYEYLNTLSSKKMPTSSTSIKKCVNPYAFAMNQNSSGYFTDLEYTGSSPNNPPWPLATRDEFQVKQLIPYYNMKLTLQSSVTGYLDNATTILASVWNAKPTSYSGNNITIGTGLQSFLSPVVSITGGYSGASTSESPVVNSTTSLAAFKNQTFYDLNGAGAPTSHTQSTGYGPTKVLDSTSTNNATTYLNVTGSNSPTVYVAFLYNINGGNTYYITWATATISLVTTYK